MTRFTPLKDFEAEVYGRKNQYVVGLGYTVRPGNEVLAGLVTEWVEKGMVRLGEPELPAGQVSAGAVGIEGTITTEKKE